MPADKFDDAQFDHEMLSIVKGWQTQINTARKYKEKAFGDDAEWAMRLFDGNDVDKYWENKMASFEGAKMTPPAFLVQVNKLAEVNQLFGPALYVQNPTVVVSHSRRPIVGPEILAGQMADPMILQQYQMMMQQQGLRDNLLTSAAGIFEHYINYSQFELDKKRHCRKWITEAILKGMGVCWTELYQPPGMEYSMIGSFYDTVDNLIFDSDADEWSDIRWVARRRVQHVYEIEKRFNIPRGALEKYAYKESAHDKDSKKTKKNSSDRTHGKQNHLLEYYEIYSKLGFGGKLSKNPDDHDKYDELGDYCYIAVCQKCPYPLNVPSWTTQGPYMEQEDDLFMRVQWPIPFWAEKDCWPFTPLYFHEHPTQTWPMAHFKFARAEMEFVNWGMSFLATKTATSCNTVVGVVKAAGDEIKHALQKAEGGYSYVELEEVLGKKLNEIVQFLDPPAFNHDIYKMVTSIDAAADKRLGLNEMIQGAEASKQMRSAAEAEIRHAHATTRPADFSAKVEDSLSKMITKEAFAMRWLLERKDIEPVVGPIGGYVWDKLITSTEVEEVVREFDFRVEAGSTRKPNKARLQEQANASMQVMLPIFQGYYQAFGDPGPMNELLKFWGKAYDYENIDQFLVPDRSQQQQQQAVNAQMEEQRRLEEEHQGGMRRKAEEQQVKNAGHAEEQRIKNEGREEEQRVKNEAHIEQSIVNQILAERAAESQQRSE